MLAEVQGWADFLDRYWLVLIAVGVWLVIVLWVMLSGRKSES